MHASYSYSAGGVRCPRHQQQQQRQHVTEGTAMAPRNGPNEYNSPMRSVGIGCSPPLHCDAWPDLRLPSQPQNTAAHRLVPNYTVSRQMNMCANNWPCTVANRSSRKSLNHYIAQATISDKEQEGLAVASIARDDPSTLPGDDPSPRAH